MSNITIAGNAAGTATFTVAAPATNTNRTLTLPDTTGTLLAEGGAITEATPVTASGTVIDFTGIPSWAKRITIMASGLSVSGTTAPTVQIGDSGGIETTGYASAKADINASNAAASGSVLTTAFRFMDLSAAADVGYAVLTLVNVSGNIWLASGTYVIDASTDKVGYVSGSKTLSGTLDRVRITDGGTDTFDAGTVNVMWEG